MSLPRELRDKIYEYLLRVDRFAILKKETPPDKLNLSILRVNQTLHAEASRTLNVENPWVCVTIEPGLLHTLCGGQEAAFPAHQRVSMGTSAIIRPNAVATMTLQTLSQTDPAINRIPLVLCLFAIPRLCRMLTCDAKTDEIDIAVYLNRRNAGRVQVARQDRILNWLEVTRGFGRARIFSGQGHQSLVKLGALMISPAPSIQEYFDRASAYQKHALLKDKSGRLSEARYDYQDCYDLNIWSFRLIHNDFDSLDDSGRSMILSIADLMDAVNVPYAFLLIKLRDLKRALYIISWTLDTWLTGGEKGFNVETAFVCGLRDLAIGADNGAAYCFLQILWEQPGHHGADNAVDEIESRLKCCTGSTERIVLYNIEHVLKPFRHRKHGSAVMDIATYGALVERWLSCVEEVDSIGYRSKYHCDWGTGREWLKRMYNHASAIFDTDWSNPTPFIEVAIS